MRMQILLRFPAALLVACAAPLAAQAPSAPPDYLLAAEGIEAAPPPGFPAFERFRDEGGEDDGRTRLYRSRSGTRIILVLVLEPFLSWGEGADDVAGRREVLRTMAADGRRRSDPDVVVREDSTHIVAELHRVDGGGRRMVDRWYVPRTGLPRIGRVTVVDDADAPDPAADPAITAFLDAARPRIGGGPPMILPFRAAGVEMWLPAGVLPPEALPDGRGTDVLSDGSGIRGFRSRSGNREVIVFIIDEAGGERWPAERRIRRMRGWMGDLLRRFDARIEPSTRTAGELGFSDLRFSRLAGEPVTGRGRIYTTLSGPRRLIAVLYSEPGSRPLADEAEIVEMLDSLRLVRPDPR